MSRAVRGGEGYAGVAGGVGCCLDRFEVPPWIGHVAPQS